MILRVNIRLAKQLNETPIYQKLEDFYHTYNMTQKDIYVEMLNELFSNHNTIHYPILKYIPSFFKILKKLYSDKDICGEVKVEVNSALSYFVLENDYISDFKSAKGYLDDLFICVYVLNDIMEYDSSILYKYWDLDEKPEELLRKLTQELDMNLEDSTWDILAFLGINMFKHICATEANLQSETSNDTNMEILQLRINDLRALLNFITKFKYRKNNSISTIRLKDYMSQFDELEWNRVVKILEYMSLDEIKFNNLSETQIEERMSKLKRDVLLSIDESILEEQ